MSRVIGSETTYVGDRADLRGQHVRIECVRKNGARQGGRRWFLHEEEEVWAEPVTEADAVLVRPSGTLQIVEVPAVDLEVFRRFLRPVAVAQEVRFEEPVLAEARWAASHAGVPFDTLVNDAVARHLRAMGLHRAPARSETKGADT